MTDDYFDALFKERGRFLPLLAKEDFYLFVEVFFAVVEGSQTFVPAKYVEFITHELMLVAAGFHKKLILNLPPRHLKSLLCSVFFPAFLLARDPKLQIAVISHNTSLAKDLALKTHRLVTSHQFQKVFPEFQLAPDRSAVMDFETKDGGGRLAASFDTGLTGRGFHYIVLDDPLSAHNVFSEVERENVNSTYHNMIASRFNNPAEGRSIIVHQRLHDDDLTGHLLSTQPSVWRHIVLPLVAPEDAEYKIGNKTWSRRAGESLMPEHYPPAEIEALRMGLGSHVFETQYQQNPAAAQGAYILADHLKFVSQIPSGKFPIVLSCDTAIKTEASACFSVVLVIMIVDREYYVLDVQRGRFTTVGLVGVIEELIRKYGPQNILIEDAANGRGLHDELRARRHSSQMISPGGKSKLERLARCLHVFEHGRLFIMENQRWTVEFRNELLHFPMGRYDDQVDALTQFLNWATENLTPRKIVTGASTSGHRAYRNFSIPKLGKGDNALRPRNRGIPRHRW